MPTMLEARGAEYVTKWINTIPRRVGISVEYLADALQRAGLATEADRGRIAAALASGSDVPEINNLDEDQAKRVVAEMQAIRREIDIAQSTNCWCCGLPLRNGECEACD